jgi:hypothetical protein
LTSISGFLSPKDMVLIGGVDVLESKGHGFITIGTKRSDKRCLTLVFFL